ncbi:protein kinase [Streptomyces sp. NPDC051561]|uniref:protein kinase domain-containing protein n=1 Tax=Streptomyces sp. NPDC051561 TaxID=3365658 RepID=UPI0037AEDB5B
MDQLIAEDPPHIGPYRLIARLGAGGMGRVYLARSEGGRTVAVKVVQNEYAQHTEFRARFAREVTAARRVGGSWTAAVLDADTDAQTPWVATQYVPGPDLHAVVTEQHGPLPEHSVRVLANRLALALQAIHEAGLVHRDLKPSNVLVTVDGPRVIDFGIARALDSMTGDSLQTRTGMLIGSPGFMSPEQVRGLHVTAASDVFCLGSVLAYAATGRQPFGATGNGLHAQLFRIAEEEPDLAGVPQALLGLVRECLHKDPARRPTPQQIAARTATEGTDEWLPGSLLGQLGRQAAQLLDFDPLRPHTALAPTPVRAPARTPLPAPVRTPPEPAESEKAPAPIALADAPTLDPENAVTAPSYGKEQAPQERRRPAFAVWAAAGVVVAVVGGLLALRLLEVGTQGAGASPSVSAPKALQGSWQADLEREGGDGMGIDGITARLSIGAKGAVEYSVLNEYRLCVWESTITDARTGSEGDAIRLSSKRLKSAIPKSEASGCKDSTTDYGSSTPPDGTGAFVTSLNGWSQWEDDPGYFDHGNDGKTLYKPDTFNKAASAKGPLPEKFRGSWSGRGQEGSYRLEATLGTGAAKDDVRLVSIGAVGQKCVYTAAVFSRESHLVRTAPGEPADSKQPSGCAKSAPSLSFRLDEDKGKRKLWLDPIGGATTPIFEAQRWAAKLNPGG